MIPGQSIITPKSSARFPRQRRIQTCLTGKILQLTTTQFNTDCPGIYSRDNLLNSQFCTLRVCRSADIIILSSSLFSTCIAL